MKWKGAGVDLMKKRRRRRCSVGHNVILMAWMSLAAATLMTVSTSADSAELIVVEADHCAPCLLFDLDIGRTYARTAESRIAPLRRLPFGEPFPAPYRDIGSAAVAPSFILIDGQHEIGRFEGYSNDELFWMSLSALLQRLPSAGTRVP